MDRLISLGSDCSGIEAICQALFGLKVDFEHRFTYGVAWEPSLRDNISPAKITKMLKIFPSIRAHPMSWIARQAKMERVIKGRCGTLNYAFHLAPNLPGGIVNFCFIICFSLIKKAGLTYLVSVISYPC